jgi:hypothetical protein
MTLESERFLLELYIRYFDRSYLNLDFMTTQNTSQGYPQSNVPAQLCRNRHHNYTSTAGSCFHSRNTKFTWMSVRVDVNCLNSIASLAKTAQEDRNHRHNQLTYPMAYRKPYLFYPATTHSKLTIKAKNLEGIEQDLFSLWFRFRKTGKGFHFCHPHASTDKPHRKTPDSDSKPYAEWRPKVCSHQTCQTSTIIFSSCSLARARYSSRETIEKKK